MQFETRKLRSRARNNYLSMLKVLPVLTTCWLTLLLIGSIEGLLFDDANSYIVIKYVSLCEPIGIYTRVNTEHQLYLIIFLTLFADYVLQGHSSIKD